MNSGTKIFTTKNTKKHEKRRFFFFLPFVIFAFFVVNSSSILCAEPPITQARHAMPRYAPDPIAARSIAPTFDTFPDSSLVDFSFLLDPPAGKHGFVMTRADGHFYYEKTNARAKFWGATVAASNTDIPKEKISEVVDVLARGGCNLLRLHELDNRGGERYNLVRRNIIDEAYPNNDKSTVFDAEYRDRVDWWIACAQKRGLYVYLVVRGYRTFRAGDGVASADQLDRSAKPYSFFNPRLIELQKQYASEWLIQHVNPYTGVPNGLNPAVAFLEVENEDSLFCFYNISSTRWLGMVEPYRTEFIGLWNEWLKNQYGSTDALRRAWTNERGECPLGADESLEKATVKIPSMNEESIEKIDEIPWADPLRSPARARDGVRFAAEVQRRYFSTMREHLRSLGCRALLTATVDTHTLIDTWTVAAELDFTAQNAYMDHPAFAVGQEWVGRQFFRNANYLKETSIWGLAPRMAQWKWTGKPWMVREWTLCWPNEYRVSALLDIAAIADMQDYDGLIHFDYKTWGNPDLISAFGMQPDPARWGMAGYAALLYLRGDLPPQDEVVRILYTDEDLATWASSMSQLYRVAWTRRIENWSPSLMMPPFAEDALFGVTSGRAGGIGKLGAGENGAAAAQSLYAAAFGADVSRGREWVLFDPRFAARARAGGAAWSESPAVQAGYDYPWMKSPDGFPIEAVRKADFVPFGPAPGEDGRPLCRAFLDPKRNNLILGPVGAEDAMWAVERLARALQREEKPTDLLAADKSTSLTTLGGRLERDEKAGVIQIATDSFCAVAGELSGGGDKEADAAKTGAKAGAAQSRAWKAGALTVRSVSPTAAVVAASLDGKPLVSARRFSIKMATVAVNRGQKLTKIPNANPDNPYMLEETGGPPVQTLGKPSAIPTRVSLGNRMLAEVYMENGTWEIVVDRDKRQCLVFCDTPNIRFQFDPEIFGGAASDKIHVRKYFYEYPPEDTPQTGRDLIYPGFAKYAEMRAAE